MNKIKEILQNILFIISRKKFVSTLIIILTIISTFAELLSITMVFPVIQSMLNNGENVLFSHYLTFFNNYDPEVKIKIIILLFVTVLLLKNIIILIKSFLTHHYEQELINNFSSKISKKLINSNYKDFSKLNNNQMFNLLNKEIKLSIRTARAFFNFLSDLLFLMATTLFAIFFSQTILLFISIIFFIILPPIIYFLYRYSYSKSNQRLKYSDILAKEFRSLLDGLKVIKIFNLTNTFISNLNFVLLQRLKVQRNFGFLTENLKSFFEIIIAFFLLIMVFIYLSKFEEEKLLLSIPFFATLFLITYKVVTSAIKVIKDGMYIINLSSSLIRLINIYKEIIPQEKYIEKKNFNSDLKFDSKIILKDLSFTYDQKDFVFRDLDLQIKKSDKIFISGPSGSGKSTLVELLCGLNNPTSGNILVDKVDLKTLNKKNWLNCIGFVGQKNILFNKSIKENIFDGNQEAPDELYKKALKISQTENFLIQNNITDDEIITQTQDNLSGGQLKRISIARALIKNPKILILDEATNEFDKPLENDIINNIIDKYPGITVIFISHNFQIKNFCNRSFVIKDKKIYEEI